MASGIPVVLVAGSAMYESSLDAKGGTADNSLVLKAKLNSGKFTAAPAAFKVALKKQNLFDELEAFGFFKLWCRSHK